MNLIRFRPTLDLPWLLERTRSCFMATDDPGFRVDSRPSDEEAAELLRELMWVSSRHRPCCQDPDYQRLTAKYVEWVYRSAAKQVTPRLIRPGDRVILERYRGRKEHEGWYVHSVRELTEGSGKLWYDLRHPMMGGMTGAAEDEITLAGSC